MLQTLSDIPSGGGEVNEQNIFFPASPDAPRAGRAAAGSGRQCSHFLLWLGIMLLVCKLGSCRQLDYPFNTDGPEVLANLTRLAGTQQTTCPVNQTLEYFVGRIGSAPLAGLDQRMVNRLVRRKALDEARLQRDFLVLIDGTGYLVFGSQHCVPCLTQKHGERTVYLHQVLEAKLLGPGVRGQRSTPVAAQRPSLLGDEASGRG